MIKINNLIILILLISNSFYIKADIPMNIKKSSLPSEITSDMTLLKSESPYIAISSVSVNSGVTLTVEAGVDIQLPANASILVDGNLLMNGTENEPIKIRCIAATMGGRAIIGNHANIILNYVEFENMSSMLSANYGKIEVKYCKIYTLASIDCIAIHYSSDILIENCELRGEPIAGRVDCIDCDAVSNAIIRGNTIYDFADDGIDIGIGSSNVLIDNNFIYNCASIGISIGEWSQATETGNIIIGCYAGIESHTGSTVIADGNILYKNNIGVQCHHGGDAGGTAIVKNTIITQSFDSDFSLIAKNSFVTFSYCLSDVGLLEGIGNIFGNPMFKDVNNYDFALLAGSPAIDSGDPDSPKDADNTRIDIGTFNSSIVTSINEVVADKFYLYPNPANEIIYINFETNNVALPVKITVRDISGKIILSEKKQYNKDANFSINVSDYLPGIYFIEINNNKIVNTKKIFIL